MIPPTIDPFAVLGLQPNASEDEVRSRYLELVHLHSPESEPEKFGEINRAYEAVKDPIITAQRLLTPPQTTPNLVNVIEQQKKFPPNLSVDLLLATGNRPANPESETPVSSPGVDSQNTATNSQIDLQRLDSSHG